MREKEVRFQVSSARSAAKELGVISTAVRQTPLTAMLSPCLEFLVQLDSGHSKPAVAVLVARCR